MITLEEQQKLFLSVSRKLKKKMTVYAVGGTALTFLGIKDTTLDIDLVFETNEDREVFKDAIKSIGYQPIDPIIIYGIKRDPPEMLILGESRFDLFVANVIDFIFSEKMRERAVQIRQYDENLILKIADLHDIILMKCATERVKDKDDARKIIDSMEINWGLIIEEAKNQTTLGKPKAIFELGCFLEDLKNSTNVNIPKSVLDELWELLKKQTEERK